MNRRNQPWFFATPFLVFAVFGNGTVFAQYTLSTVVTSGAFGTLDGNGIAVDGVGSIYATGTYPGGGFNAIFEVSPQSGTPQITVVAGSNSSSAPFMACSTSYGATSVRLDNPSGLGVDNSGNVYIAQ